MIIHQVLHGYSQGHNKLASSFPLSVQDDEKMKMLSDWSEYSGCKDNSYITTYPLSDGRHYVVAKSWYADDMERPGCVWTHSLIIDLNDLDEKFDFRVLINIFRRPTKDEYSSYSIPIKYSAFPLSIEENLYQEDVLIRLYSDLIASHSSKVYRIEHDSSYYQGLILLLLQYLPLNFIKNITMCSGSAYGRKSSMAEYNLQFAVSAGLSLYAEVRDLKYDIDQVCDGLKSICRTMIKPNSDTSDVLRLFSSDIEANPTKLCAVGLLLNYLDDAIAQSSHIPTFSRVLELILATFPTPSEGVIAKKTFCKRSIANLFSSESVVLSDLATKVSSDLLNYDSIEYHKRVVDLKVSMGVKEYAKYLATLLDSDSLNSAGEYELKHSSEYLHADDYSYLAYNYWPVYMSLVTANPNILKYSFWVDLPEGHFISAYEVFRKHRVQGFDNWTNLFQVVLYRSHLIDELLMGYFAESVPNLSWEVMEYLNHSVSYKLDPLLKRYCSGKISEVLLWLRQQNNLTMPAARFVVENITPSDEIVKGLGSAGWIALYDCNKYENLSYFTFMFILGHNWNDELGLKFIKRSFDQLHQVLAADSCPRYIWERIEPYTAKLRWYNEWDKCKKLRKGIVRYLKLSGYNKDVLPYLTTNKNLNETLESIWEMV